MKFKILFLILFLILITNNVFSQPAYRIVDSSGNELNINSDGTLPSSFSNKACTLTVCSSQTDIAPTQCDYTCDGTADDVQIQAAIAEVAAGAGVGATVGGTNGKGDICLSEGLFNIAATIEVQPGVNLIGKAGGATRLKAATGLASPILAYNGGASPDPAAGLLTHNIFIDCFGEASTNGIDTKTGTVAMWDWQITNSQIFNCVNGVVVDDPWGFRFLNSQVEDGTGYGIVINKGATKTEGAIISDSKIIQNGGGIQINNVDATIIDGNELNCTVNGCWTVDVQSDGSNGNGNIISNNKLWGGEAGINIDTAGLSNLIVNNVASGLEGVELVDNGTSTVRLGNRGDGAFNTNIIPNGMQVPPLGVAFSLSTDTDAAVSFGATGYTFSDTDATVIATVQLTGYMDMQASAGTGGLKADGDTGGCLMLRDNDNGGWTECCATDGVLNCGIDADGTLDGTP